MQLQFGITYMYLLNPRQIRHAFYHNSVLCWIYEPHSKQRAIGSQVFLILQYNPTEIVLTSLTPSSPL